MNVIARLKPGLSIRYKFLLVTTALLVFCVSVYLLLASHIFKRDKTELVFDLTRSLVGNLSVDTETLFRGITDKMKLVALLSQEESGRSHIIADIFQNDADVVFMARMSSEGALQTVFFQDQLFLQTYSLQPDFFKSQLERIHSVTRTRMSTDGQTIWNATLPPGPPLIGFGKNVILQATDGGLQQTPFAIVSFVRADRLLKSSSNARLSQVFMVNHYGEMLLDSGYGTSEAWTGDLAQHHLYQLAKSQPIKLGVAQYNQNGSDWLGAYSFGFDNRILILSQVSGSRAYAAVDRLLVRSLLFALIVATLAFIAAILFSRSLTKPILKLVEGMTRVAEGDLKTSIEVKSRDEIAVLAESFNSMIGDLRQSREQLEEVNRDLEKKVHDRTQKLAEQNETVKKTQEALLQSTRLAAVGEIAGRAAHEVLNPLTSIMTRLEKVRGRVQSRLVGPTQMLSDIYTSWEKDYSEGGFDRLVSAWKGPSSLEPNLLLWDEDLRNIKVVQNDVKEEVEQIVRDTDFLLKEGGRINKIVQGMRSLTVVKGDLQQHSVHQLLHESVTIMADLSQHSRIEILEVFQASHDEVKLDGDEFIQSVTNLIRNSIQALRATPTTLGRIVLRTREENGELFVEIEDNGPGILPEYQERLFETQFSTKSADEGTGLGLSISRRFIRAYGGDIVLLHSAPGRTLFRVTLPLIESNQQGEGRSA